MGRIRLDDVPAFLVSVLGGVVAATAPFIISFIAMVAPSLILILAVLPGFFGLALLFGGPCIFTGLLVFVVPGTSYFAEHRTSRWFAFPLVFWAAQAGGFMMCLLGLPQSFLPVLIVRAPVIVVGLLVFVVPVTPYFAERRTSSWFGFALIVLAMQAGGFTIADMQGFALSALYGAWCGGMTALCWWFTSRGRWLDIARRQSPSSSP